MSGYLFLQVCDTVMTPDADEYLYSGQLCRTQQAIAQQNVRSPS